MSPELAASGLSRDQRVVLTTALLGLLGACGTDQADEPAAVERAEEIASETTAEEPTSRTVQHALGTVEVPADPQRVVAADSLTPAYLAELGMPVVAACTEGDYVPELLSDYYADVERLPECQTSLPYERIAALQPDLIIGLEDQILPADPNAYANLSEIAPTIVLELDDDRVGLLAAYGEALGQAEEAESTIEAFYADLEGRRAEGTFSMVALFGEGSFDVFQDNFVLVDLLERAGLQQVPDATTLDGYNPEDNRVREVSFERVDLLAGDLLVPVVASEGDLAAEVDARVGGSELWQRLPAVAADRVVPVDSANAFGSAGLAGFRAEVDKVLDVAQELP